MLATETIKVQKTKNSRLAEVDFSNLQFGNTISDHMVVADYYNNEWHASSIVPFGNMSMSPTMLALHYGQIVFEGMKAFKTKDGSITIFRIKKHYERFCKSVERMCIPAISYEQFEESLKALLHVDAAWVPQNEGCSLYIRPFVFASEERFGVKVSEEFKFIIFTGPVGPYFANPVKVKVEDRYVRAAHGGTGFAKCAGNYGGAFYPTSLARKAGFDQVLWTDGSPELNIEESGTMNVVFIFNNTVVTPPISDSILDGVTRDSFIALAKDMGYKVEERKIGAAELIKGFEQGTLLEACGTGTAAVVAPIQSINIKGTDYKLPEVKESNLSLRIKQRLSDIRTGVASDVFGWNTVIKH